MNIDTIATSLYSMSTLFALMAAVSFLLHAINVRKHGVHPSSVTFLIMMLCNQLAQLLYLRDKRVALIRLSFLITIYGCALAVSLTPIKKPNDEKDK